MSKFDQGPLKKSNVIYLNLNYVESYIIYYLMSLLSVGTSSFFFEFMKQFCCWQILQILTFHRCLRKSPIYVTWTITLNQKQITNWSWHILPVEESRYTSYWKTSLICFNGQLLLLYENYWFFRNIGQFYFCFNPSFL